MTPDKRRKLQQFEEFERKVLSGLLEIAQRVFNNREDKETQGSRKLAKVLVTAIRGERAEPRRYFPGRDKPPRSLVEGPRQMQLWGLNCRWLGHLTKNCPVVT